MSDWDDILPLSTVSFIRETSTCSVDGWTGLSGVSEANQTSFHSTPSTTNATRAEDAFQPLQFISRFKGCEISFAPGLIKLRLALAIKDMKIRPEVLRAWGLKPNYYVVCDISFNDQFLQYKQRPTVTVGQASTAKGALESFLLSHSLSRAILEIFFPKNGLPELSPPPYAPRDIMDVMETSNVDFFTALAALSLTRSHQPHDAIETLCDPTLREDLDARVKKYISQFARARQSRFERQQSGTHGSGSEEKTCSDGCETKLEYQAGSEINMEDLAETYKLPIIAVELAFSLEANPEDALNMLSSEEGRRQLLACCQDETSVPTPSASGQEELKPRKLTPQEREEYDLNMAILISKLDSDDADEVAATKEAIKVLERSIMEVSSTPVASPTSTMFPLPPKSHSADTGAKKSVVAESKSSQTFSFEGENDFFDSLPIPQLRRAVSSQSDHSEEAPGLGKLILKRERSDDHRNVDPTSVEVNVDPADAWQSGGRATGVTVEDCAIANYWIQYSHLMRLALFFEDRVIHANRFCRTCAKPMEFEGLKPAVCARKLCTMAFQELGLGFDLASEIVTQPTVVDLLISMTYSAACGITMTFGAPIHIQAEVAGTPHTFRLATPRPHTGNRVPGTEDELSLDYERLNQCMRRIPPLSELTNYAERGNKYLRKALDELDILMFPLLQWILTSVRAHIRPLSLKETIRPIPALAQFVLLSSTPEREARFQRLKRAAEMYRGKGKGSFYAWHGSPLPKWHSIMRVGLKNLSGTNLMSTGAAYGSGIYMATNMSTSVSYCSPGRGSVWQNSQYSNYMCMSLCEVVNHKDLKPPSPHYVVPNEAWITTRFLFILPLDKQSEYTHIADNLIAHLPKLD